jgi:DNA-binding IclR family transcriptional regulator
VLPLYEQQRERLRANGDALAGLLRLAEHLRRANAAKWGVTQEEWQAAVRCVLAAPVPHPDDPVAFAEAIRAARSAGMRLGDSGEARLGSVGVGRHPDSSLAGRRFPDDLDSAHLRLAELQELY